MNLTRASRELFRRTPDECFPSLGVLSQHCQWQRQQALEIWQPSRLLNVQQVAGDSLMLDAGNDGAFEMNDWSFGQLCRLSGVAKETVNRLSPETAGRVFDETLPRGPKPLQLFTQGGQLRSIHAASYTRLFNADLLALIQEFAVGFEPPPKGFNGATGLYGGEQDMFCFLIDPAGWTEIGGEAFAPGFFVWNSEVGSRSVGIETFWFQAVCQNHIVWDATEVIEFSRKHTANVHDAISEIRCAIQSLVHKRDQRRDAFVKAVQKAMATSLGSNAEEVQKAMSGQGIPRALIKEAIEIAQEKGRLTIFCLVDALTRIAGKIVNAGERLQVDQKAAGLLALAV
jgi:predicted GNAT family acetyltransferase